MINKRQGEYTLKLGDKEVNLQFSMTFWLFLDDLGYKIETLEKDLSPENGVIGMIKTLSALVYAAGKAYAKKNGTQFNYSLDDVPEWFGDYITEEVMKDLMEAMASSTLFGKKLADSGKLTPQPSETGAGTK